jgi:predicted O-methyltransferase YrrM
MTSLQPSESNYPNWFRLYAEGYFRDLLQEFKDKPNLAFLQIGAFTGDASVWLANNILTDKSSILIDVDTWQGSDEEVHHNMDFSDVERVYDHRTMTMENVIKVKMTSTEFLITSDDKEYYDFIYIDGDHTADAVFKDASLSWRALKPGGIMAFDDYEWEPQLPMHLRPQPAIDLFLTLIKDHIDLIRTGPQIWIRKRLETF